MKPAEYWRRRSEEVAARQFAKADAYQAELAREYARATEEIRRAIEVFYQRYAENGEISMAEARRQLFGPELRRFKMTLEEFTAKAKDNADGRWTKQLNEVYYRVRVSRYEALLTEIQQQVEMLAGSRQRRTGELLGEIYEDTYYRTIYEIQRGTGFGTTFAKIDRDTLETVLGTEFAGSNWSKRIWGDRDKLVTELRTKLAQSFIRGESAERTARDLAERMGVSLSNAERLVQTETAFFVGEATAAGYKASGVVDKYEILATLDSKTSEICRSMDGKVFNLSEREVGVNYPPLHARCRSTVVPYFEDEIDVGERIARSEDGKAYYVSGDITYEQWIKDYVDSPKPPNSGIINRTFRRFKDETEADKWIADVSAEWIKDLTPDERDAINQYTGSDYEFINDHLRGKRNYPALNTVIDNISSGLRKFNLKENIIVFRAWDTDLFRVPTNKLVGTIFTEKGFYSTSLLREKALEFSHRYVAEVRVPAGARGAPVREISKLPNEFEFLMDRGTRLRILEAKDRDGGIDYVFEVVLDENEG